MAKYKIGDSVWAVQRGTNHIFPAYIINIYESSGHPKTVKYDVIFGADNSPHVVGEALLFDSIDRARLYINARAKVEVYSYTSKIKNIFDLIQFVRKYDTVSDKANPAIVEAARIRGMDLLGVDIIDG